MGGGIEFSGAQFAGRGIGGERWKGDFIHCYCVSVSVQVYIAWRDLQVRDESRNKKSLLLGSPLSLLTYLRIGNHPFPGRGFGELCTTIGHVPVCLLVRSFVRSLVCLLLLLSADEDMGLRIEQSRRSSLT